MISITIATAAVMTITEATSCINLMEIMRGDKTSAAHKHDRDISKRVKNLQLTVFKPRRRKTKKVNMASKVSQVNEFDNNSFIFIPYITNLNANFILLRPKL
ncbi:MAG: hypothetical protein KJ593_07255 [Candidatus Omnitrophica bacterium]|nr:hypothetical protein [Candidatus Omnitrophota bacterium]